VHQDMTPDHTSTPVAEQGGSEDFVSSVLLWSLTGFLATIVIALGGLFATV
jgi:hypothetical protein